MLVVSALSLAPVADIWAENEGVVAVYSAVSPAYVRSPQPGGGFKPETYAFGEGGECAGAANDFSIDRLRFAGVVRQIAPALAKKNYVSARDPNKTDLLIMVYWGMTSGTNGAAAASGLDISTNIMPQGLPVLPPNTAVGPDRIGMENANSNALEQALMMNHLFNLIRDHQDVENAKILGYLPEMARVQKYKGTYFDKFLRGDIIDDIEESRYYVVLMAYDFQTIWKTKQRKLLWETRFSIRERRNDFSKALAAMAENASRYFGQDSHGLIRQDLPATRITFGDAKVLEYEPEKSK